MLHIISFLPELCSKNSIQVVFLLRLKDSVFLLRLQDSDKRNKRDVVCGGDE